MLRSGISGLNRTHQVFIRHVQCQIVQIKPCPILLFHCGRLRIVLLLIIKSRRMLGIIIILLVKTALNFGMAAVLRSRALQNVGVECATD